MQVQRFDQEDGSVRVVATDRGHVVDQVLGDDFADAWARLGRKIASKLLDSTVR